jgi:exosome complex component RRP4
MSLSFFLLYYSIKTQVSFLVLSFSIIFPLFLPFKRGHGTYVQNGQLIASLCGVVERVNKLITVRPLKARYMPEVGDVVVGRITEVSTNRWRVDVNARSDAHLLLSGVDLPGGVLRRRTHEDALQMRSLYVENDLISAEVQQFFQDGSIGLHTRHKYGKLERGVFVAVSPALIKRTKSHFHTLACGVDVILGVNGYCWVTDRVDTQGGREVAVDSEPSTSGQPAESNSQKRTPPPLTSELRMKIARVRNAIVCLNRRFITIYPPTILDVYKASLKYAVKEMLRPELLDELTCTALERSQSDE